MRLLRFLLWCAILGILGIIVMLFLVQNLHVERLVFFGLVYTINFAWVLVGAAAFGFLLALIHLVPGRIASALYVRTLDREVRELEFQVALLSEQRERLLQGHERILLRYERLFTDHSQVVAERDRMRAQLATVESSREVARVSAALAAPVAASVVVEKPRSRSVTTSARGTRVLPPVASAPASVLVTLAEPPAVSTPAPEQAHERLQVSPHPRRDILAPAKRAAYEARKSLLQWRSQLRRRVSSAAVRSVKARVRHQWRIWIEHVRPSATTEAREHEETPRNTGE
jgi:hypothetical protein